MERPDVHPPVNPSLRRTSWRALATATALLAVVSAGAAAPATAAPVAAAAHQAPVPPLDGKALQQALDELPKHEVSGALAQVSGRDGRWTGTSGVGDLRTGEPVPSNGSFRIGSASKVFASTVVLQLAAEHRLSVDDCVQDYLPDLLPDRFDKVTIGQLLNHTSGLPINADAGQEFWGDGTSRWFVDHRFGSWPIEHLVKTLVGDDAPMYAPGSAQTYNGVNTFIAGLVVEKVTGHSFADEVRSRITRPLGLSRTYVPEIGDARLPGPHSHGYLTVPGADGGSRQVDISEQAAWPWAEGGMISTAADLDRFMTVLFRGRLLPPAQQKLLFTVPDVPNVDNKNCAQNPDPEQNRACYSMGLMRVSQDGQEIWGKTGSRPGYTSGMFATRDLSRRLVYSINPTTLTGAESPYLNRLVLSTFLPMDQTRSQTRSNGSA
ncbi:serine hydrolase domain-containing protein [Streptomyces sp. NPDC007983]|uniref:serine hydrolase domain-containing protein n=1 Tax=Streptomyces sp. NPDC007983 TaxID=3364800 RepID=UPI0036EE59FB